MIRPATLEDVPRLVEMGQHFLAQTEYRDRLAHNPEQMRALVTSLISGESSGACGEVFVADHEDEGLVGMIGLLFYAEPLSGEPVVAELFWWTEPAYRGLTGIKLLNVARRWAQECGATQFRMIAPNDDVAHIYEALHFEKVETVYSLRMN